MEPDEMAQLVRECEIAAHALGSVSYEIQEQKKKSLQFRKSLYIVEDMKKGDTITEKNVRSIRPGLGLSPKYFYVMVGEKVNHDLRRGTALVWDVIV